MANTKRSSSKTRLRKAQLSFYVDPERYRALKDLSERTGVPQQVYMREGLEIVLRRSTAALLKRTPASSVQKYADFQAELQGVIQRTERLLMQLRPTRTRTGRK